MRGARTLAAAAVAVSLLAAACGARLDDEHLAAASRSPAGDATAAGQAQGTQSATGPATPTSAAGGGQGPVGAPVPGAGPAPAGGAAPAPGAEGAPPPPGGGCAPDGASDVGVTADAITLGQVGTISGPVPGLGQTAMNGAKAYAAHRNSQGGVCGRELRIVTGDDRLDTGQNRAEHARMASEVFGFVGGWSVVDDGGASVLAGTNIPDVTISITEQRAALPNNFSTNPIDLDGGSGTLTILQHLIATYQPTSAAVVWGAQATSRARAQGFVADLQRLGMDVSVQREVAITETNYVPVAQEIENRGVQLVVTTLEIGMIARLAQAFRQIGYQPAVPYYGAQTYGEQFVEQAGPAADGAIIGLTHPIAEEAGGGGANATFVEWYQRVNPGQPIDFFAYQGWVAADMAADAIEAAGPAPTRDGVLAALSGFTTFDADGLVAPFNPAGKIGSPCFLIVTVQGGEWVRVHPEGGGFACP